MNKICTSQEQSQKLKELGIDINTADMCWSIVIPELPTLFAYPITDCDNLENKIPAWSLSALMELIPAILWTEEKKPYYILRMDKGIENFDIWYDDFDSGTVALETDFIRKTPLDAAFEMVVWLKENKKI